MQDACSRFLLGVSVARHECSQVRIVFFPLRSSCRSDCSVAARDFARVFLLSATEPMIPTIGLRFSVRARPVTVAQFLRCLLVFQSALPFFFFVGCASLHSGLLLFQSRNDAATQSRFRRFFFGVLCATGLLRSVDSRVRKQSDRTASRFVSP
jgi:hypothetical protein